MRLALISDIHANLEALRATLADISGRGADRIVCLGDIVGYNANPAECIALIRDADALCVAGNHDLAVCGRIPTKHFPATAARAVAWTQRRLSWRDLQFLAGLPLKAHAEGGLVAVHGALHPTERVCHGASRHRREAAAKLPGADRRSIRCPHRRVRSYP